MKRFLFSTILIFAICTTLPGLAQKPGLPYDRFTGEITQTNLVQTSLSKDKAYTLIKAWIYKTFPNYREVVKVEDMSWGRLVFQDREPVLSAHFKSFSYRVTIDIKDGSYTCTINNVKTLSDGAAVYTSADLDFSTMGMYGQDIDDIGREMSVTRNKKELAKLHKERSVLKSFLRDYHKSHCTMNAQFNMIQSGLRGAVFGTSSLASK